MLLIADSGSTKTSWTLLDQDNGNALSCNTAGINPMYQDEESIFYLLQKEFTIAVPGLVDLFFYGAGCINKGVNETVRDALGRFFNCSMLSVETDLMAAARSLCQDNKGIACILGTGSNSCYYNGKEIIRNISPLGYMLGDEGSGAVIGRKFIADLLKNQMPEYIREKFFITYNLEPHNIMESVYKKPFPNRFLAQFTRFIHENIHEPSLINLVTNSFIEFFNRNIRQYPEALQLPVQFTGGVGYYFRELLEQAAMRTGYVIGDVTASPMEGLIKYHLNHKN